MCLTQGQAPRVLQAESPAEEEEGLGSSRSPSPLAGHPGRAQAHEIDLLWSTALGFFLPNSSEQVYECQRRLLQEIAVREPLTYFQNRL